LSLVFIESIEEALELTRISLLSLKENEELAAELATID